MRVESLQHHRRGLRNQWSEPFSTLHAGRVAATESCGHSHRRQRLFQYPPCGSSRCNMSLPRLCRSSPNLSVPSMRVESLQRHTAKLLCSVLRVFQYPPCGSSRCNLRKPCIHRCATSTFSTLHAGRVAATIAASYGCYHERDLSVPSMRVESLQPYP